MQVNLKNFVLLYSSRSQLKQLGKSVSRRLAKQSGLALMCFAGALLTTLARADISAPSALTGQLLDQRVTLSWQASPNADGYNIYRDDSYVATVKATSFEENILEGNRHIYYIVAFTSSPQVFSSRSNNIVLPTTEPGNNTPPIPQQLTSSQNGTTLSITWLPTPASAGVIGYNIYRDTQYVATVSSNQFSESVTPGVTYSYQVTAFDQARNFSQLSEPLVQQIPSTQAISGPPTQPTNLTATVEQNQARIEWRGSQDDSQVNGYNIYRDNRYLTTVTETRYTDDTFNESHSYFVVAFDNEVNFSSQSETVTASRVETPSETVPSRVTGISATIDNSKTNLNWNASTDNSGIAGYNVYLNNSYVTSVIDTQYTHESPGVVTDQWHVVAFDQDNHFSEPSDLVSPNQGSTDPTDGPEPVEPTGNGNAPGQPQNLTGTINYSSGIGTINLSWTAPPSSNPISAYNIYENNLYLATVHETSFQKTVLEGELNSYFVIALDNAQNYSVRSQRVRLPDFGNQAPTFEGLNDVTAYAGETLSVLVKPVDSDSDVPGLQTGKLPVGMKFDDNRDGTRTLVWYLLEPQVGLHEISITAMDSDDPSLQTTRVLRINVLLPDDLSTIPNLPPAIDHIHDQVLRTGDTVTMHVKGTDPNGTIPHLKILNPPAGSTFLPYYEDDAITELKWTTGMENLGTIDLWFEATDVRDSSMKYTRKVTLDIKNPSDFIRSGSRLKDLANRYNLKIGYASLLGFFAKPDSDLYKSIAADEFNIVSAENSMKWGYTNPERGEYRWAGADNLVQFAADNNMLVHGHTLVWYSSLPQWVQKSALWERESLMYGYIDAIMSRYPDVYVWDVVNEAFEEDGSYRNSVWFQAMGEAYIDKAFFRARSADPNTKLIYNDYNISWAGPKSDATYELVKSLKDRGVPLDGIGFQMHIDTNFSKSSSVRDTFNRFAALGLDIYITELDVSIVDGGDEQKQANIYADVLAICLEQPKCKALQVWGFTDRHTWLPGYKPLLFDQDYQPKASYRALQNQLSQEGYPWR